MRVHEIVSFSARKKFRLTYPPRYECYRCYATFVLRKECYDHVKYRCRVIHNDNSCHNMKNFLEHMSCRNEKEKIADHQSTANMNDLHLFDVGIAKYFAVLGQIDIEKKLYKGYSSKFESRLYSKYFTYRNRYSYELMKPDYYAAKLAQHTVDAILVRNIYMTFMFCIFFTFIFMKSLSNLFYHHFRSHHSILFRCF